MILSLLHIRITWGHLEIQSSGFILNHFNQILCECHTDSVFQIFQAVLGTAKVGSLQPAQARGCSLVRKQLAQVLSPSTNCGGSWLPPCHRPPHVLGILVSENLNHGPFQSLCGTVFAKAWKRILSSRHFENWPEIFLLRKSIVNEASSQGLRNDVI